MNKDISWVAYHKQFPPKQVYSEEEYNYLLEQGWADSPARVHDVKVTEKKLSETPELEGSIKEPQEKILVETVEKKHGNASKHHRKGM